MKNSDTGKSPATKPFSIRLTDEERRLLGEHAGSKPLGAFIRSLVLAEGMQTKRRRSISPVKDHDALAKVLAQLGQSRLANNLNQLAKAVNIGALPVTQETEAEIIEACGTVIAMRTDLVRALGLAEESRR